MQSECGRGIAYIVCNSKFESGSEEIPSRPGAKRDMEMLRNAFSILGFKVKDYSHLTSRDILKYATKRECVIDDKLLNIALKFVFINLGHCFEQCRNQTKTANVRIHCNGEISVKGTFITTDSVLIYRIELYWAFA